MVNAGHMCHQTALQIGGGGGGTEVHFENFVTGADQSRSKS